MTQHDNILFVPPKLGGWNFRIHEDGMGRQWLTCFYAFKEGKVKESEKPLPPGSWSIIGETAKMGEEAAGKVVLPFPIFGGWIDYEYAENHYITALESLSSLLRSLGLDTKKNYLVLKTNEDQQTLQQ